MADTKDDLDLFSASYAKTQDEQDPLSSFRNHFIIPTIADLHSKTLTSASDKDSQPCTYLCGNSLGLQPTLTSQYQSNYLKTWATKGVYGHFTEIQDSRLPPWLHVDDDVVADVCDIVGAKTNEVAVMQTLTANLHFAMASFYRPDGKRWKIIMEGKAFPSDHYAVESQLLHHNKNPSTDMILLEPEDPNNPILSTQQILTTIDKHSTSTSLLLLPGIQFYTGQAFDIKTITAHAQSKGIVVGWDLAHAAGNIPLQLHDWNVDFAAWCSYKYLNCGPGSIGGLFVHDRHSTVNDSDKPYTPRLGGWWGSDKTSRFAMENVFTPIRGAAGWQLSNPSVADMTALRASLDVFNKTSMAALRRKSVLLTGYLESLLLTLLGDEKELRASFAIITPSDPQARGAQLSIRLKQGLLEHVLSVLEKEGVVLDERKPDVIRVAPAPLYNSWSDVLRFVLVFKEACKQALRINGCRKDSSGMVGGEKEKQSLE